MGQAVEKTDEVDELEQAVDEAIRQAGGLREAVWQVILRQRSVQDEIGRTVSAGYVRRGLRAG